MATIQTLLWLREDTAAALRAHAAARGEKLSAVADELLRIGLGLITEEAAEASALPAIEAVMRRVVAEQARADAEQARVNTERLATLIVKAIREASVGRWLTLGLIERVRGRAVADEERERAFTAAGRVLRGRMEPTVAAEGTAGSGAAEIAGAGAAGGQSYSGEGR